MNPPLVCPKCRTWFEGKHCPACGFSTSHRAGLRAVLLVLTMLCLSGLLFALDTGERTPLLSDPAITLLVLGSFAAFFVVAQLMMAHPTGTSEESEPASTRDSAWVGVDAFIHVFGNESADGFDSDGDGGGGDGGGGDGGGGD